DAGAKGNRKHDRACGHDAATRRTQFRFGKSRVAETAQMADLMKRDGLQIVPVCLAPRGDRPRIGGIEEDVRLEELSGRFIDEETGGRQHSFEVGTILET